MKKSLLKTLTASVLAVALLSAAGCKKYTEVESVSQYSIPQAFADVSNAFNAIIGVYDELMGDATYGLQISQYFPYDSDEGFVRDNIDNGRRGIGRYQLLLTNANVANPFRALYRGVEKANLCIEQIPLMPQYTTGSTTEKKELGRLYAEALTLRAQFLFELIRNWGDVPAPMEPAYKRTNLFVSKANRDSTYDKILVDLAIAKDLLPWRTEVTRNERITKGAAKALRARIALFRGGYALRSNAQIERRSDYIKYYQIAMDECADLMANRNQHTLNPSFENIWRNVTSFTKDPFGEILFEAGAGGGNGNSDSRMGNYSGPRLNNASRYGVADGGVNMMPNYFYAFDSVDTRRDVSITLYQVPTGSNIKAPRRPGELTPGKYRRDWRVPLLPGTVLNVGFNWVFIRFSDVLLMYAEAANEINNGPSAVAIAALEEVRKRAYKNNPIGATPSDKTGFFNAVVNERYLEFGEEAIRKYDLLRWNLLATKLSETRTKIQQIRDRVGPYINVPQYVYYKNTGEELTWYTAADSVRAQSFWRPTQTPPANTIGTAPANGVAALKWVRLDWAQHLTINSFIDGFPLYQAIARFFTTGKSELFPYDQATIDSYQGRLPQNPGY